jgi:hypothetical protein
MLWVIYLAGISLGWLGFLSLRSGLRTKSPKEEMQESMFPEKAWVYRKEKSMRIYVGIMMIVLALVIFLKRF